MYTFFFWAEMQIKPAVLYSEHTASHVYSMISSCLQYPAKKNNKTTTQKNTLAVAFLYS